MVEVILSSRGLGILQTKKSRVIFFGKEANHLELGLSVAQANKFKNTTWNACKHEIGSRSGIGMSNKVKDVFGP